MVHIMKDNGQMEKQKDMENHVERMEIFMKENGKMISKKEKEKKYGLMEQFMKGNFMKGQKMVKGNLHGGRVVRAMRENSIITKYVEKDYIFLVIIENMKDIGKIIK